MTRRSVILFAHGSLLCGAGRTLQRHAETLRQHGDFVSVHVGFLNYTNPPFEDAVRDALAFSPDEIYVQPWFLVAGKFVNEDLPPRIAAAQAGNNNVAWRVGPVFGRAPELADAWRDCVAMQQPVAHWATYLEAAPTFCESRADCPLFGKHPCPAATNTPATPSTEPSVAPKPSDSDWREAALLIMAHGSPRQETCDEIEAIAARVRASAKHPEVLVSYLDCNAPTIGEACDQLAAAGHNRIIAVPHFLHIGRHVCDDVPTILESAMERNPGLQIHMTPFIGVSSVLSELAHQNATAGHNTP